MPNLLDGNVLSACQDLPTNSQCKDPTRLLGRDYYSSCEEDDEGEEPFEDTEYMSMFSLLQHQASNADSDDHLYALVEEIYDRPKVLPPTLNQKATSTNAHAQRVPNLPLQKNQYFSESTPLVAPPTKSPRSFIDNRRGDTDRRTQEDYEVRRCSLSTVKRLFIGDLILEIPAYSEVKRINDSLVYIITDDEEIMVRITNKNAKPRSRSTKL